MRNQRGQASIFVAFMFNVLFIFFAMAINVALIVNDKINLQNSTDLAAYYAATKQAEVLNAIAHMNYQIRQSYKLLAWRYRVLGGMGLGGLGTEFHPAMSGNIPDSPFSVPPSVCVNYSPTWLEINNENLCKTSSLNIPPLPVVPEIAGFLGYNLIKKILGEHLQSQFNVGCDTMVAVNTWFALNSLHSFRLDQRNRKQIIAALAASLSKPSSNGDFLDLDGQSVLQGAQQTFVKNLTYANRQAFEGGGGKFQLMNSMAGLDYKKWLVEVDIAPMLLFTDALDTLGCRTFPSPISKKTSRGAAWNMFISKLHGADLSMWIDASSMFLKDVDYQLSLGFEKNPWYMPYVGVSVAASPREIFMPFNSGIPMVARAFAKPFGGRIGPWYKSKWDSGATNSDGNLVDSLVAPRVGTSSSVDFQDPRRLPNYSRFPGDQLGLMSRLSLGAITQMPAMRARFDFYSNVAADYVPGAPNDALPWDYTTNQPPLVREMEIAAIAPDLFDITYYSIETNFYNNYFTRIQAARDRLGIPSNVIMRPDLGSSVIKADFSVQDQIALARDKSFQRPEAYYFVRNKTHLLTSWVPGSGSFSYEVAESLNLFGKCALPDDNLKFKNPGSCAAGGGRTGYSVKLISRDALFSNQHRIGGEGAAPGAILNPPPDGW
jgi:hypothetical protein